MQKPKILIPQKIWNQILEEARSAKAKNEFKALFMFCNRSDTLKVVNFLEVPVKMIKNNSPSGPIFRWNIPKGMYRTYYPKKDPHYYGTILVQKNLEMTLHYAYFMGVDFKHYPAFNINLWIGDDDKEIYKAFFVYDAKLEEENQTHGEFIEAQIIIKE